MPDLFSIDHDPFANAFGPYEIAPSGRPRITVSPEAPVEAPVGTGAPGYAGRLQPFQDVPLPAERPPEVPRAPEMPWQATKGSWYSQYEGNNRWRDYGDQPRSNALGVPDAQQGIALPSRHTLGMFFDVQGPDGRMHRVQQTDVGPAPWTGRGIDISAAAADKMGYAPENFPTNGRFAFRLSQDQTSPMQYADRAPEEPVQAAAQAYRDQPRARYVSPATVLDNGDVAYTNANGELTFTDRNKHDVWQEPGTDRYHVYEKAQAPAFETPPYVPATTSEDPWERGAARIRTAVQPPGGRREAGATYLAENWPTVAASPMALPPAGSTPEQQAKWGFQTALGLVGGRGPFARPGEIGSAGGKGGVTLQAVEHDPFTGQPAAAGPGPGQAGAGTGAPATPGYGGGPGIDRGVPGLEEAQRAAANAAGGRQALQGLPGKVLVPGDEANLPEWYVPGPNNTIHSVAEQYMREHGLPYNPPRTHAPVDVPRAQRIAEAFEDMPHAPDDPAVQASYNAMVKETIDQFRAIEATGLKIEFIKPWMKDPYARSPRLANQDMRDNNHLWVFPTDQGFGSSAERAAALAENPLLAPTGITIDGRPTVANDIFRIVHDYFGHFKDGNGFRAAGEENAWRSHSAMYSDAARPAMTTETRGQNSWLNYGPHGERNRYAKSEDTTFADQKIGLLPDWAVNEGRHDPPSALWMHERTLMLPEQHGILNPQRVLHPGIYKPPEQIVEEARAALAPEHPALKELFGVTRKDLYDIGQQGKRAGNMEPVYAKPQNPQGSYVGRNIMTPGNADRMLRTLKLAEKYPELLHGTDAWYVMDPAFWRLVELEGPERAIGLYKRFNTLTGMASPGSDVLTEIQRGTTANWMAARGQFGQFQRWGGMKEGEYVPPEFRGPTGGMTVEEGAMPGHPYHPGAQAGPMGKYVESGQIDMTSPKVPLYIQASGVPETGFQTKLMVPDAHIARSIGAADVRTTAKPGVSMRGPEYHEVGPWYRENVAKPLGIEAVPAQGRQWSIYGPQTGVRTKIGAPKLEILAQRIWDRAHALGMDPKRLRDQVLRGENRAAWAGLTAGLGAAEAVREERE